MMKCRMMGGFLGILLSLMSTAPAYAEQVDASAADDSEIINVEKELEGGEPAAGDVIAPVKTAAPIKPPATVNYSEVVQSKASGDTIVIQKNYMPKTERFQAFGGLSLAPNDVFFRTMGLSLRMGYHFNETWGVELLGTWLSSNKGKELRDLETQGVSAASVVSPRSYLGVDAYFNSVYGKAALYNRTILPFEIYQTIGIGKMSTATSSDSTGFHLGLGQLFSISRSEAFRVDLSLIIYQSKNINGDTQTSNTFLLTFGYGRFFPEATYR